MKFRLLLLSLALFMLPAPAQAAPQVSGPAPEQTPDQAPGQPLGQSGPRRGGKALMLAVFGSSTEAALTFDELVPLVQRSFPRHKVVVPYTSGVIRNKLNANISDPVKKILSPAEMLEKLKAEGYTDISVVSTLLFAGVEHDRLEAELQRFSAVNKGIKISYLPPFLAEAANRKAAVATLGKYMIDDGINVVVAHGTRAGHPAEQAYRDLAAQVAAAYPLARLGSIEGLPDMKETLAWVESRKEEKVRFLVFMFVAGEHAENDIASAAEGSLFSAVRAMGKTPSIRQVNTGAGRHMLSLGLDFDYRQLLLDYYSSNLVK